MRGRSLGSAVALVACSLAAPAVAAVNVFETEHAALRFGAYASNFSLLSRREDEAARAIAPTFGGNAALLRLEWEANLGQSVNLVIHDRFFWLASTLVAEDGTALGLGSTIPPQRSLQLQSYLFDESGASLTHDLDRLALSVRSSLGDFTVGRQAITWGMGNIFMPNDIWSRFGPFELDTSQKRGVDAMRVMTYPAEGSELELVLVDRGGLERGSARDLSGGVRVGWSEGTVDYYLGVAKNYERALALMGSTVDFDIFTARAEVQARASLSDVRYESPLLSLGVDYQGSKGSAVLEYYFNGPGTTRRASYARELLVAPDAEIVRGDRYFIGKHYVGALATYAPLVEMQLTAAVTVNLVDPSAVLAPSLAYNFSQEVSGSLGAYVGIGRQPRLPAEDMDALELGSEFGYLGVTYYFQLSGFI